MAKWLKDYLNFGSRKAPPQPPKPDYTESEILRAYRAQKERDFEDPYETSENRVQNGSGTTDPFPAFGTVLPNGMEVKIVSPKHRLIKVESQEFVRCKNPLSIVSFEEPHTPLVPSAPAVGDADYSDPFDARPDPRARPGWEHGSVENSSSYMEPFEAQRVITELQHSFEQTRPGLQGSPQLYDSPYDERGHPWAKPTDHERESRLPQDDERPADEYDQPWEWKKENISRVFAVQFDGTDRDHSTLPHGEKQRRVGAPRSSPPSSKATSLQRQSEPHTVLGERVDPAKPLEQQVWYHGALSRSEAETLLTLCKECSYLVRNSQTSRNNYSLSLRSCHGFMHMKFCLTSEGRYVLGENSPPFTTIPAAIHYYTTHKLPIRGAEHLSLLFPVVVQTL
ncbi:src homology 2 domain containing transforming protein D, a [Electrophorus electricus]|uniref:SH2 domain-containing protein n=1 Tax=Electrophorus electricus TaxID=8005 RepID=A0A4W4EW93_ELEEL|nr:src homology 2 domain containing transforming protein D, a [Electrophorus electricus]XP_026875483.2 src homology 2 domain containing transforming protein D, a [Electrophorus electricus]XP_026875484.2 src homology 2 domain containing transforming protein D, a [Electrophorus electricus]XP_026875486.2 src homology 2 domain containing transforming protein D, a [Electrophorus electricus]XP_026875487.2 src homology 2 domain containing transforming protein D, a [Electrophorus electricus]XP_0268754